MTTLRVQGAADRFWAAAAGVPPRFPRDLRRAVALSLPVAVVDLPRLRISGVHGWLQERGIPLSISTRDRGIRACLVAHRGAGMVFLDGGDSEDEQRFSLAHETAHFLLDYLLPRERAMAALGPAMLPVLDGQRAPTASERVDALLARVPLRLTLHLMERSPDGLPYHAGIAAAESDADALALELLAPQEAVRSHLSRAATPTQVEDLLLAEFALPRLVAQRYAAALVPQDFRRVALARSLFAVPEPGGQRAGPSS